MQIHKRNVDAIASNSHLDKGDADYDTTCVRCGATPTIHPMQICLCCFDRENEVLGLKFFMETA